MPRVGPTWHLKFSQFIAKLLNPCDNGENIRGGEVQAGEETRVGKKLIAHHKQWRKSSEPQTIKDKKA